MIRIDDPILCGVVNTILQVVQDERRAVRHIKLQKLLFFCYSDFVKDKGRVLFNEKFIVYPYGFYVKSVYIAYQKFGFKPIDEIATNIKGKKRVYGYETEEYASIWKTVLKYLNYGDFELADITHRRGGVWHTAWNKSGGRGAEIGKDEVLKGD